MNHLRNIPKRTQHLALALAAAALFGCNDERGASASVGEGSATAEPDAAGDTAAVEERSDELAVAATVREIRLLLAGSPAVDARRVSVRSEGGAVLVVADPPTEPIEALLAELSSDPIAIEIEPRDPPTTPPSSVDGSGDARGSGRGATDGSAREEPSTQPVEVVPAEDWLATAAEIGEPGGGEEEIARIVEGSGGESPSLADLSRGDRPQTYRVRAGDSLSSIALRLLQDGNQWRRIYELNRSVIGPDPEQLVEGMQLRIPQD